MTIQNGAPDSWDDERLRADAEQAVSTRERIRKLLGGQRYAVLCTQSESQPYGSLIAFAASEDLETLVLATPVSTRKYRFIVECDRVAMLIDSRSASPDNMMEIEAVTATGLARVVREESGFNQWAGLLTTRHPHLSHFVHAESSALIRIEVIRYFHVSSFQEVRQWAPRRST